MKAKQILDYCLSSFDGTILVESWGEKGNVLPFVWKRIIRSFLSICRFQRRFQMTAATLAMPPFVMLMGIANLFGIGGSSLISRSLGTRDREKAKKCAAFSIRSAVSFLYGVVVYLIRPVIFRLPLQGQYCCLSAQSRWYRDLLAVRRRLHTVSIFSGLSVLPVWKFR